MKNRHGNAQTFTIPNPRRLFRRSIQAGFLAYVHRDWHAFPEIISSGKVASRSHLQWRDRVGLYRLLF